MVWFVLVQISLCTNVFSILFFVNSYRDRILSGIVSMFINGEKYTTVFIALYFLKSFMGIWDPILQPTHEVFCFVFFSFILRDIR